MPPPVTATETDLPAAAPPLTETAAFSPTDVVTPTDVLTLTDVFTAPVLPIAEPVPASFVSPLPTPPAPEMR
ncbi:MAG TPA: hypothetical protein PKZ84_09875 [Anaerolineae bacterium]|nr:hypothetical protein [Anaerolineae bacterium]HQI84903.1 hypothetical protein [Anaerolineae bacterium]